MQVVSPGYQDEMNKDARGETLLYIRVSVIDIDAAGNTKITDNGHMYYSDLSLLIYDSVPDKTYATFEPGRWKCDGSQLVPSKKSIIKQGFVSETQADATGAYKTPPVVRFDFSRYHSCPALTFIFDPSCEDYPEEIKVTVYRGSQVLLEITEYPNNPEYIVDTRFENFDRIELAYIKAGTPERRARLQGVIFGYRLALDKDLISAVKEAETDPVSRLLSKSKFSFTVENASHKYNPDNPFGPWRDLENHTPITVEWAQELTSGQTWGGLLTQTWGKVHRSTWGALYSGGYIERLLAGKYYLTAKPETNGIHSTFTCTDILGLATGTFYKGVYKKANLYSLALQVLEDAALPKLADGSKPWKLWAGLKDISTGAPLPVAPYREVLQLIANAARCILYVDREGYIRIERISDEQHALYLDFFNAQTEPPKITKVESLARIRCRSFKYRVAQDETEILRETYTVNGSLPVSLKFSSPMANVQVSVTGGASDNYIYANAADIFLTGNGEMELVITGHEIESNYTIISAEVDFPPANATGDEINNPIIDKSAWAMEVAKWTRDYLLNRATYSFATRGNPEIDPADKIYMESQFTDRLPAYVLSTKIDWQNSVIKGSVVAKRLEDGL